MIKRIENERENKREGKRESKKKRIRRQRIGALMLTAGLMLTGCGTNAGGSTSTEVTGQTTSEAGGGSLVQPEKPQYGSGITNLSEGVKRVEAVNTPMNQAHSEALAKSGLILLNKTLELGEDRTKNYLISPTSIQMALGMTVNGTPKGSETEKVIMNVLMPGADADQETLSKEMASFSARMTGASDVSWNVANSIWVKDMPNINLRESFVTVNTNDYHAELFRAPFGQETIDAINAWVKTNTKEMIPEIIKEFPDDSVLALVNALAFEGEWMYPYEEKDILEDREFTNSDGSKSQVTYLSSSESGLMQLAGGMGFVRPYKGGEYTFVGLLPAEGQSAEDYLKTIVNGEESFTEAYKNLDYSGDLYVELPEFKTEFGTCMDDILVGLGMGPAYLNGGNPDFSQMLEDDSERLGIGTVIHKTKIEVDRKGTKAAAATVVIMKDSSCPVEPELPTCIRLDRPFVYAVVDNETGVPIFLGVQNTIK